MWWMFGCPASVPQAEVAPDPVRAPEPVWVERAPAKHAWVTARTPCGSGPGAGGGAASGQFTLPIGLPVEAVVVGESATFVAGADGSLCWVDGGALSEAAPPPDGGDRWIAPRDSDRVKAVTRALDGARSAEDLLRVWREAQDVARDLSPGLNARLSASEDSSPVYAAVSAEAAWMMPLDLGPWVAVGLEPGLWIDRAARTPGTSDDEVVRGAVETFGHAGLLGWTSAHAVAEPFHGCTTFGSSGASYLGLFSATSAAREVPEFAALRAFWLRSLTNPAPLFPICGGPGLVVQRASLTQHALELVTLAELTDSERAQVQAAIDTGFPEQAR